MLHSGVRPLAALLMFAAMTSCSAADFLNQTPSTQTWLLIDDQNQIANITTTEVVVDKGGAMSQVAGAVYRVTETATCTYTVPLSGNWSGTAVHITSTGGGCNVGYILTMDGTASDVYGKTETMSGTYRISYSGAEKGVFTGTWRGSFDH